MRLSVRFAAGTGQWGSRGAREQGSGGEEEEEAGEAKP